VKWPIDFTGVEVDIVEDAAVFVVVMVGVLVV
jgi:hypothetical protein